MFFQIFFLLVLLQGQGIVARCGAGADRIMAECVTRKGDNCDAKRRIVLARCVSGGGLGPNEPEPPNVDLATMARQQVCHVHARRRNAGCEQDRDPAACRERSEKLLAKCILAASKPGLIPPAKKKK